MSEQDEKKDSNQDSDQGTESSSDAKSGAATTGGQTFEIQKIFMKDSSFESPNTPFIFRATWQPEVAQQIGNRSAKLKDDNSYEVVLTITMTVKLGDKTAYLVEVHQAGIFKITGYSETELAGLLGSFCPNILFPYASQAISDAVVKGGFPQLLLPPINFDALYAGYMQQQKLAQQEKPPADQTH